MRSFLIGLSIVGLAAGCATMGLRPERLTLDEEVGQLFIYPAHGVFMNEASPEYARLVHEVRDNHVGGIIWFVSNVYETALLNRHLQRLSSIPQTTPR